ncbi:carotenoid 1,2-hydratase [bacterium]|nr:carotenoid 1,2-hydratase [bacterium]
MNKIRISSIVGVCLLGAMIWITGCQDPVNGVAERSSVDLNTAMSGDTTGYARARPGTELVFPADYGPHPAFKTEWWYFTGNLDTESGRQFGYELTIFRSALAPETPGNLGEAEAQSKWSSNQLYMGHFSLADLGGGQGGNDQGNSGQGSEPQFYSFERFSRGALDLAGSQASPFRVWLEDWSMDGGPDDLFPLRLRAQEGDIALDLTLSSLKPIVLQGDKGFDRKGADEGNASHYYSFTRLETSGTIGIGGDLMPVSGTSWKDHEWSTSALDENQAGWDWFSLQLSDNREIMFYVLREKDGGSGQFTNGMLVQSDGSYSPLSREDVSIRVLDSWKSPHSGATYPSGWEMSIPAHDIELTITPLMQDQELNATIRYWEGAVSIKSNTDVTGRGYVELTGYK